MATLAGFVPWAVSGIDDLASRSSPRSSKYARISVRPVSSPCDPAAGCSVTASSPTTSASIRSQPPHQLERALGALVVLVRVQVAEAGRAPPARSLTRGLYFIVHEPSG